MSEIRNTISKFTYEDVLNMLSTVHNLIDGSAQIYNKYNNEPASGSLAVQERNSFSNQVLIKDVHYRGILSMESAADHFMAFADSMTEPAKTIAPWTCVRGLLESCAIAVWFLDPTIDAKTRVGRCFAFRYEGFIEQIKFLDLKKMQTEIDMAQQRIIKVEQDAVSLGYPRLLNKNGNINGIALRMPSIIDLIGTTLDREADYRLLSAIAHGHHWALWKIAFRINDVENPEGQDTNAIEKHLHPESAMYLCNISVTSFAKVLWCLWRLYGWDTKEIEHFLDQIYMQLHYKTEMRFWRSISIS
ncbi:MAG TPA: hypothetical protein VKF38_08245 [Anaerolineaceae bacterium]|nr:hypothetical protein [Anaerolineaceae bacterium]